MVAGLPKQPLYKAGRGWEGGRGEKAQHERLKGEETFDLGLLFVCLFDLGLAGT